jgi:hypothetical protein
VDGTNLRRIARVLGIHHRTGPDWINGHAERLLETPMPEEVETAELDELFNLSVIQKQNLLDDDR